jgi:hypothetical protein
MHPRRATTRPDGTHGRSTTSCVWRVRCASRLPEAVTMRARQANAAVDT